MQRFGNIKTTCVYFCVNVLTSRIDTNTNNKESFYDLTGSNSTSDNSSMDYCTFIPEPDDRNQTTIISPCRKLFINDDDYNSSSNDSSSVSDTDSLGNNPYNNVMAIVPYQNNAESNYPAYSPDWYLAALALDKDLNVKCDKFMKHNWITSELATEIQSNFPSRDEINTISIT